MDFFSPNKGEREEFMLALLNLSTTMVNYARPIQIHILFLC